MRNGGGSRFWLTVVALAMLAIALRYEAIGSGFFADDYAQLGMLAGTYPVQRSELDLFTFSDGSVAEGERLIESGFYPWFTNPTLRISMFRPLASAMIWLDYHLFGLDPVGYHYHSVLWWCALFVVVAYLYRTLLSELQAIIAVTLYATSVVHDVVISWIANRCAILSAMFGLLGLTIYLRTNERDSVRSSWLIATLFSLAFGFGEYTLCLLGYVLAYEWSVPGISLPARIRRLGPVVLPALLFLSIRGWFGYTPRGSGVYVDLMTDPIAFVAAAANRFPVLVADLVLGLRGEYWTFGADPWFYAWLDSSWISRDWLERVDAWRTWHVAFGGVACLLFGLLCFYVWRWTDNKRLVWLGVGSALAIVPVLGSFPSSRLLLFSLIGFCPLVAILLVAGLLRARRLLASNARLKGVAIGAIATTAFGYQLVLGTWLTRTQMRDIEHGSSRMRNAVLNMDEDPEMAQQTIVLLAAPEGSTSSYLPLTRWAYRRSVPRRCYTLSFVPSPYMLRRVAENAFTMDYPQPAALFRTAGEQLLRGPRDQLRINDLVNTGAFRVMVLSLRNGLPSQLLVRFESSLDDPALRFMVVTRVGIRRIVLPPVGGTIAVPAPYIPDR